MVQNPAVTAPNGSEEDIYREGHAFGDTHEKFALTLFFYGQFHRNNNVNDCPLLALLLLKDKGLNHIEIGK